MSNKYIVVFTPAGTDDLSHESFDERDRALAFVTGEGHSGLDYDVEDDKALIIGPEGTVEDWT